MTTDVVLGLKFNVHPGYYQAKKEDDDFRWSDDKAELLLTVTHNYTVQKNSENIDRESVKSKYEDILQMMREELPATVDKARDNWLKDYPHTKEQLTKKILSTKLKSIRIKYREAVDSGRCSGHSCVVMLYFELLGRFTSNRTD